MLVDVQFNPGTTPWPLLLDCVHAVEQAGYGAVWTLDHLDGSILRGQGMYECFTLLGALARETTTIAIGPLVANVSNRPAGTLAVAAATVQVLSGGRLLLGLGAGAAPGSRFAREHDTLGIPLRAAIAERHDAVRSQLDLLDAMWHPQRDERFAGYLRPVPRPPVFIGVNSPHLARIAGERADGMNVRLSHPRLEAILVAAKDAAGGRPFACTAWTEWDPELADAGSARHRELARDFDRIVTVFFRTPDPAELSAHPIR